VLRIALLVGAGALALAFAFAADALRGLPAERTLRSQVVERYALDAVQSWRPLHLIASELRETVVLWEDPAFYDHAGLSYAAIVDAISTNVRELRYARGGSTITQQVAKNLFLTRGKTIRRKLQDAVLARRLERVLSKDEILEIYLNIAEWGDHVSGAEAAAQQYFGVPATQLTWSQSALLAAILPNPRAFNPCVNAREATRRRDVILRRLRDERWISSTQYESDVAYPVRVSCVRERGAVAWRS
jgi:monofunctional biosynthetic peptidoglycan transglycosylase